MGLFRRSRSSKSAAQAAKVIGAPVSLVPHQERGEDHSDIFVCARDTSPTPLPVSTTTPIATAAPVVPAEAAVTLFVTGWENVQPGPLSWVFPSMSAALEAVRKMRNAIEWSIVLGKAHESLDEARDSGAVLISQDR